MSQLILKAKEIDDMQGELKTHFLNEHAVRLNKSLGDAVGLNHIGVHLIEVQPGKQSTEYHIHSDEEECIYVLSGSATIIIDNESYVIEAGDFVGFPSHTAAHEMMNTGTEVLKCLVMGQRLTHDVADYPKLGKRLFRHNGTWDLVDVEVVKNLK